MNKLTYGAIILATLAVANTGYALPGVPPPEAPRRMEALVPKRVDTRTCTAISGGDVVLREVTALPNTLTLRGTFSGRSPSLTLLRFDASRGVQFVAPAAWAPCRPDVRPAARP